MKHLVTSGVKTIGHYRAQLGESPVWCARSQSLLWVDILQQRLLRFWPEQDERTDIHMMPPLTSAVLLTTDEEQFLVVSQSGIQLYDYAHQRFTPLCDYPSEAAGTRPNEATISPEGELWFSTMDPGAENVIGSWYRLPLGETTPQIMLANQWVPNTLQWYGGKIWFADSLRHRFYCATQSATELRVETSHPTEGIPDGSALTVTGELINARWGQSRVVRCQLSGSQMTELDSLPLPVQQPSSCTFGGPELSELYITSAREGLACPAEADGALLTLSTRLCGQPAALFRL